MPRPTQTIPTWATDATFASGPKTGSPTIGTGAPSAGIRAQGFVAGLTLFAGHLNRLWQETLNHVAWLRAIQSEEVYHLGYGVYGDGSDGDVTLGAGTTTLTRAMYYGVLDVPNGATLATAGYPVFARSIRIENGGVITRAGNAASGATAGAALTGGSLGGGGAGTGGATGNASNASGQTNCAASGTGGTGGNGTGGTGGTGGTNVLLVSTFGGVRNLVSAVTGQALGSGTARLIAGGSGGGGGGGDGAAGFGGGGGGGGGVMVLCSTTIDVESGGLITVQGGAGANGTATDTGGGGGGVGGVLYTVSRAITLGAPTGINALGGAGGASGGGSGTPGASGGSGAHIQLLH